ncbi:cytochrome b [Chenggangzhangella methanolivorans]|uniref:Cytochrome b n=1 Tax=Chenggangzhangella methanolivorans TaxID=1437009 RepID=A0A9E6R5K4_9HYPH|nr:cytochrome b [Chenggangzhangella methanolivorans]QZN98615.1 cytochrome b [Chenggangzhangella methanolivorans]
MAALVIALIAVGIGRGYMPKGPERDVVTMLHKATGVVVLVLMFLRIRLRLADPPPPPDPSTPAWQAAASGVVHWAFYALLMIMPVLGWAGSNALGRPVSMYGLFDLPTLTAENKPLGEALYGWHEGLGYALLALVVLHVGAALHHRYVRKDAVLSRMTLGGAR